MEPFNKEMLILYREKYVAEKNTRYHARMKEIMDEELANISVEKIREEILSHIRRMPWSTEARAEVKVNLNKLNNSFENEITGRKEHIEFWGVESSMKMFSFEFKGYQWDTFPKWETYALTKDPQIAKVRELLKKEFPGATIRPEISIEGETMFLTVAIVYHLPPVIQGCEEAGVLKLDQYSYIIW